MGNLLNSRLQTLTAQRRRLAAVTWAGESARSELAAAAREAVRAGVDRSAVAAAAGMDAFELARILGEPPTDAGTDAASTAPRVQTSLTLLVALALTAVVAWADHVTGPLLPLAALYVVPVCLTAWFAGRAFAYVVAITGAMAGFIADRTLGPSAHLADASWNLVAHLGLFLLVAETAWRTRHALLTERTLADRERAANARLEETDQIKTTLLTAVSHDLRDPLTVVLGSASTLAHGRADLDESDIDGLAEGIAAAARRMSRIVDGLLDVERLAAGAVSPRTSPTRIDLLATQLVGEWSEQGRRSVALRAEPAVAVVDPVHVERALENLLRNAFRHGAEAVNVVVRRANESVEVAVEDDGPGVPAEERGDVFALFRTGSGRGAGLGVGLYLVAQFAKVNGGTVTVGQSPAGGASFRLRFPAARKDA